MPLVILASLQLWISLGQQELFTGPGTVKEISESILGPSILVKKAEKDLILGRLPAADRLLTSALSKDPFYVPAWIKMAELYNSRGEHDRATAIADYINVFSADTALWQWDKALLDYELGMENLLSQDLPFIIRYHSIKRQKALDLALRLWPLPDQLIAKLGHENLPFLFKYCMRKQMLDYAIKVWPMVADSDALMDRDRLGFIDRLWSHDHIRMATDLWKKYFDSAHLLHNGDFSTPVLNRAFGWRAWKNGRIKGVLWKRVRKDGRFSIHFEFLGTKNLNLYHFHQIVPVRPGAQYVLTGKWRSRHLTTDERPFIQVTGVRCSMKPVSSGMIPVSQDEDVFEIVFSVPDHCSLLNIRVRRKQSLQIDNMIGGDMWLSEMNLKETEKGGITD